MKFTNLSAHLQTTLEHVTVSCHFCNVPPNRRRLLWLFGSNSTTTKLHIVCDTATISNKPICASVSQRNSLTFIYSVRRLCGGAAGNDTRTPQKHTHKHTETHACSESVTSSLQLHSTIAQRRSDTEPTWQRNDPGDEITIGSGKKCSTNTKKLKATSFAGATQSIVE